MKFINVARRYGARVTAVGALVLPALSFAQSGGGSSAVAAIDTTDLVTGITNQETSMQTIGLTILGALIVVLAFRLVRKVMR